MTPKNSLTINSTVDLKVDSLSFHGGRGVGRHEGIVVFVGNVAPGDLARVRITSKKKRFWEGELVEVLEPSTSRREPPCPVAFRCGGCSWQHVDYTTQLLQKAKILNDSLRALRAAGVEWETLPFVPAPDEFYYRSRVQLQIEGDRFGFFAKRSHELVEIKKCWISEAPINARLATLQPDDVRGMRKLELRADESATRGTFTQVNRAQNKNLIERTLAMINGQPNWIFDLYAGSGNLTVPLAAKHPQAKLTAVELSHDATDAGRKLLPTANWLAGDVGARLKEMPAPPQGEGVVVLDPPRIGATPDVMEQLLRLKPKQIVYVSCNPTTFARDCTKLIENGDYRLLKVQGLDMFPQTEHVELIASLCAAT